MNVAPEPVDVYHPDGTVTSELHLPEARAGHSATILADGRVLIAGGQSTDGELKSAIHVQAHKFSKSAQEKIAKAGGKAEVLGA